jgi:hypothetical protein
MQQWHDLMVPQQDRAEPSSVQQRCESALDEPAVYSPRLDTRKPCRGKGASGFLTTRLAEAWKVINNGGEDNDDGDLGAFRAGPRMARQRCSQGQQGPCVCVGGVKGKNQDLGLCPRVENQSSPMLLPMSMTAGLSHGQEGKEGGSDLFILRERMGCRVWEGVTPRSGLGRGGA